MRWLAFALLLVSAMLAHTIARASTGGDSEGMTAPSADGGSVIASVPSESSPADASASTDGGEGPSLRSGASAETGSAPSPSSLAADEARCAEDIDANGWVDIFDIIPIANAFGQAVPQGSPLDIDHDGVITVTGDITLVGNLFAQECKGSIGTVQQQQMMTLGEGMTAAVTSLCYWQVGNRPIHPYPDTGWVYVDYGMRVYCFIPGAGDPLSMSISCQVQIERDGPPATGNWTLVGVGAQTPLGPGYVCQSYGNALVPRSTMLRNKACWQFFYQGQNAATDCRGEEFSWVIQ